MADIFLSYARPNAGAAASIAEALSARGYSVWFDADLPAHRAYAEVIEEQLEAASAVVVLWSKDAVASQWVRSEANRARESGRLVQVRLDGARLPMPFDQIQCADLAGADGDIANAPAWRTVVRSIAALAPEPMPLRTEATARPTRSIGSSRRGVLAGGVAAAAVAAGGGWWWLHGRRSGAPLSPQTAALMAQAKTALWQNTREGQNQGIAIYRQIVDDIPTYSEAWGRLSMAYAWTSHWRSAVEGEAMRSRALSAAQQALALDPDNQHALVGRACAIPFERNWLRAERGVRDAIAKGPDDDDTSFSLAFVLSLAGRNREAVGHMKQAMRADSPTPGRYTQFAAIIWSAGDQEQLDQLLDEGMRLYPTHLGIWFTRFYTAMMSGRPGEALALGADKMNWPTNIPAEEIEAVIRVAKAVESRSPAEADAVTAEWMKRAHDGAGYAENAVQFMATLGRNDEAFQVLRALYFSEGFDCGEIRFDGSQGTYSARNDRLTNFLFNPALKSLRSDQRFTRLIGELGFPAYWKAAGKLPDYLAHGA